MTVDLILGEEPIVVRDEDGIVLFGAQYDVQGDVIIDCNISSPVYVNFDEV